MLCWAIASGPEGSYSATITFPTAGQWTLSFESPDLVMEGSVALRVAAPVGAAPNVTTPAATQAFDTMLPLLAVLVIAAALILGLFALRSRRTPAATPAGTQVSAGT